VPFIKNSLYQYRKKMHNKQGAFIKENFQIIAIFSFQ